MAASTEAEIDDEAYFRQFRWFFHPRRGDEVKLSNYGRVASGPPFSILALDWPAMASSNVPIPRGEKFSVKILQKGTNGFKFGVTIKCPLSAPEPSKYGWDYYDKWSTKRWLSMISSGQYWLVEIWDKGQKREQQWVLDCSAGNTFGWDVSEKGELHIYHNGRDAGVARKGLPTDQPVWGFVDLTCDWKVEAIYSIPKGHSQSKTPAAPPQDSSTAGHPQDSSTAGHPQDSSTAGHPQDSSTAGHPQPKAPAAPPQDSSTAGHPQDSSTASHPQDLDRLVDRVEKLELRKI